MPSSTTAIPFLLLLTLGAITLYLTNKGQTSHLIRNNGCQNFDGDNSCKGQSTDNPDEWINRNFQTPPRGNTLWKESFQDYSLLQGYVQMRYSSGMNSVNLVVYTRVNPSVGDHKLVYVYDGVESSSNQKTVDSSHQAVMQIEVRLVKSNGETAATLNLEPVDFYWNHPSVNQPGNYKNGQKGAIVELFGWPYKDITQECEFLGKAGYMGVKVFPPQESILDFENPENGELNPWYWMYQPVSYKLHSRQGSVEELRTLVNTCRRYGVRVYADAVVNHMSGNGNDAFPSHCAGGNYWGPKGSSAGSPFYTHGFSYENWKFTGQRPGNENPAVPYGPLDFHCARSLNSWTDGFVLNYGWLVNLCDLNTESEYVRQRIADYITDLISLGFSGIRIDAAKHISPENLAAIFAKLKNNLGGQLTPDFTAYLEVIIGGEKDLLMCNDNNYNYGTSFEGAMRRAGISNEDINKIKIWSSDYPKEFPICGQWVIPSERFAIQLDCHDDQNPGSSSRDMGDKGSVLIKEKNVDKHRNFEVEMFTRTDGNWQIKLLLSSYSFVESKNAQGPPDGLSDCSKCVGPKCSSCTKSVSHTPAYDPNACGYSMVEGGQWKEGKYTRVHRDTQIINAMRHWMGLSALQGHDLGLSHC